MHIGIDNLNVVRIIQGLAPCNTFELINDGDLLHLVKVMFENRMPGLRKVSKVMGHATSDMVVAGQVRALDRVGNDRAGDAADFGRRKVPVGVVTDSRRHFAAVCGLRYPVVASLHRFFIAILTLLVFGLLGLFLRRRRLG